MTEETTSAPFTRQDYLNDPERYNPDPNAPTSAKHRRYYGQFVTDATVADVGRWFGDELMASTDRRSFNDIPLDRWDRLAHSMPHARRWEDVDDYPTLPGLVSIAKEAARQYVERGAESV